MKCGDFGHKLEDCDKASKDASEAIFVEEEMVQYCDANVEQYCNNVPVFDKDPTDGIEDGSEEDEALTLMIFIISLHLSKIVRKL